jgi:tetratricopeptide (TPR) repeat protein
MLSTARLCDQSRVAIVLSYLSEKLQIRPTLSGWQGTVKYIVRSKEGALQDCNQALSHAKVSSPLYAEAANSRGLVWLRLKDYDKSIADFDASLNITPHDAWSLYGREIDEMRTKRTVDGEADIAQAKAISADIGDTFGRYGIVP